METVNAQAKGLTGMIQMIKIEKLSPHKDNPRKDLGDISELAESIKSAGILQNLTVVPYIGEVNEEPIDGLYKVVIGHRRLAAAKIAGLTELPCIISNMDYKEQIATMLLENMQRSDLTIYEQAEGFQMMLDLGESVNDISHKTGFSETTVRRRVKMLDLDKDKFKKSVERGATLMDYAELEKIEDVKLRNKVLDKVGTNNFKWELTNALEEQKRKKKRELQIASVEKFATKIDDESSMRCVQRYYPSTIGEVVTPNDADTTQYFYCLTEYGSIDILVKRDAEEDEKNNAAYKESLVKLDEIAKQKEALEKLSKQAYQLRSKFIKELSNQTAKKCLNVIMSYLLRAGLDDSCTPDFEDYFDFLNIKIDVEEKEEYEDDDEDLTFSFDLIKERVAAQPEFHFLVFTYLMMDSSNYCYYQRWDACYTSNAELDLVYEFLTALGYEMSDEEITLRDGTHELFVKPSEQ